jgi:hypothetical protein
MRIFFVLLIFCEISGIFVNAINEEYTKKLEAAFAKVTASVLDINKEWSINLYPAFLKTCAMHKSSWEVLKYKYMKKILSVLHSKTRGKFVASFLGRYIRILINV